jgi:hypothetical protein
VPAFDLTSDLALSIAALAGAGGVFWFASHRAAQPADPLKPRLVPWRGVIIASGFAALIALVHLVNLAGVETGR